METYLAKRKVLTRERARLLQGVGMKIPFVSERTRESMRAWLTQVVRASTLKGTVQQGIMANMRMMNVKQKSIRGR
jgi:hypothetical protein